MSFEFLHLEFVFECPKNKPGLVLFYSFYLKSWAWGQGLYDSGKPESVLKFEMFYIIYRYILLVSCDFGYAVRSHRRRHDSSTMLIITRFVCTTSTIELVVVVTM